MADYNVGVLGLSSPPAAAVRTQYRPAVQVRNNGIHEALASGYLRIYAAGLLIFETEVYSNTLAAGATGLAQAVDYWTPAAEGTYIVNGYVTTPLDQVENNNNLAPVTIIVSGEPVPPPSPVAAHASQHEEGGTDEVSIDGLKGRAADAQTPFDHASNHQPGGSDVLDVTGLTGVLATAQTPAVHKTSHQGGGSDELSVAGLQGELADPQTPKDHATAHILAGGDPINPAFLIPQPVSELDDPAVPAGTLTPLVAVILGAGKFAERTKLRARARINFTSFLIGESANFFFRCTQLGGGPSYSAFVTVPVEQAGIAEVDMLLDVYDAAPDLQALAAGHALFNTAQPASSQQVAFSNFASLSIPISPNVQVTAELCVTTDSNPAGTCQYAVIEQIGLA